MTQQPVGEVTLRNANGEQLIPIEHESLYARGLAAFCAAVRGEGEPSASAEDGVKSLSGALAVAFACYSGGRQVVKPLTI
jgi:1,5-anhydro-D-fructose reductase (1,5-anhydro-D-mannitol-forming)